MHETSSLPPPNVMEAFATAAITALQELVNTIAFVDSAIPLMQTGPSVSATITLQRPVPGQMILILSADTAVQLATRYLPEGTVLTEELIDDVAGEFGNVIAGQAKTILKGTPFHFLITPPKLARASQQESFLYDTHAMNSVSVSSELGQLFIYVELCASPSA